MESFGGKFSHFLIKECSHLLVGCSFFLLLNIYYSMSCATLGDIVVGVTETALKDSAVWMGGAITNQLTQFSYR